MSTGGKNCLTGRTHSALEKLHTSPNNRFDQISQAKLSPIHGYIAYSSGSFFIESYFVILIIIALRQCIVHVLFFLVRQ